MKPMIYSRRWPTLAAQAFAAAIAVGASGGHAQTIELAQAQQPPAAEVPSEDDDAKRKARAKADEERKKSAQDKQKQREEQAKAEAERRKQERAKADADRASKQAQDEKQRQDRARAEEERRKQERAKAESDRANKQAQDEKQRQDRARAEEERRKGERAKADAERAKTDAERIMEDQAKADAARAKQAREQQQAEEKTKAEEQQLKKERAKLEQDRAKLARERAAAEREQAKAAQAKQQQRAQQLKQQQERLQAEEARLKSVEDQLKARDDRARAEIEQQRRRGEQLRDREQGLRTTERRLLRLEDVQRQRQRRVEEGGRIVIEEPDSRRIVKDQGRAIIRHDETERFRQVARPGRTERRDGITVHYFTRPDGTQIVSEVDDDGQLIRRYRRTPQGRVIALIDNSRHYQRGRPFFQVRVSLPPPVIRIPRERYIVEYSGASEDELYEALEAPPVERLARTYSLEEIRYSEELRGRMRRIDLDEINFEFGSWEVTPDQLSKLERLARAINRLLRRSSSEVVLIEGYTDAVGTEEDNLTLSDRRAESVAVILSEEFGVPPENLVTQGYGEQFLKVETEEPERVNRRVAVRRITPMLSQSGS